MSVLRVADNPTLLRWLDTGTGLDAEYASGLSSHLPMAALALHRLGAPPQRLQAWAEAYATRLQPARPAQDWPAGEAWAAHLGRREAWPVYRSLFTQWLQQEGAGDVLEAVLPRLMEGCAGAAFHGLIRTAYAAQAAHRQELADALAHWAATWLALDAPPPAAGHASQSDPAAVLRRLPLPPLPVAGRLIADRVAVVAAWPGFGDAAAQLRIDEKTLERLARGAAGMYAASGNFTVLHMLTSAHAVRVLLPVLEPAAALVAVAAYWRAFAAAWAASGARDLGTVPLQPWTRIVATAIAADDDHSAKLVDSCREQQKAYGGDVWRRAASRVVQAAA
jgi:Questin oxidase-like